MNALGLTEVHHRKLCEALNRLGVSNRVAEFVTEELETTYYQGLLDGVSVVEDVISAATHLSAKQACEVARAAIDNARRQR